MTSRISPLLAIANSHDTCRAGGGRAALGRTAAASARTSLPRLSVETAKPNSSSALAEWALASTAHPRSIASRTRAAASADAVGVERRERLIDHQHVGPRDQRASEREPLLHPA